MHTFLLTSDSPLDLLVPAAGTANGNPSQQALSFVLVVDDEVIIADTIVQILNRNGIHAQACYNGYDAVDLARRLQPATILTDVAMPHFDGVEAAIAIREFCPTTRIVLFSGQSATVEILERARALGHNFELLPKPIHPTELLRHLRAN